jgi:hypothetical protein
MLPLRDGHTSDEIGADRIELVIEENDTPNELLLASTRLLDEKVAISKKAPITLPQVNCP